MQIYGIDFTSKPSRRKPLTCISCTLEGDHLIAGDLIEWPRLEEFEDALKQSGPWIAGIDFPFGQARKFIETIGWPKTWAGYVNHVSSMTREEFREALEDYKKDRQNGDKEHRRQTDIIARSISPQKLYGTPVGLMFFEGAPRLRKAKVTIPGLQDGDTSRIIIEAYPSVLARQFIGRRSYKQDAKNKQTQDQYKSRIDIMTAVSNNELQIRYGLKLTAPCALVDDPTGDRLDALLCAIQAAWAYTQKDNNYGAPQTLDVLEGWIADPSLSNGRDSGVA